jgi:hypothetical protein
MAASVDPVHQCVQEVRPAGSAGRLEAAEIDSEPS